MHSAIINGKIKKNETMVVARTELLSYGSLTTEQFDKEIEKGIADVKAGRFYSSDAIEAEIKIVKICESTYQKW